MPSQRARETDASRGAIPVTLEDAATFLITAGVVVYLALRGGGYDLVVHQEAGLVLWWGLAIALLAGWLPRAKPVRGVRLPAIAVAGLIAWTALSLLWTQTDERAFAALARLVDYAGIGALAWCAISRRNWKAAAAGLYGGAVVVCALALLSRFDPSLLGPSALLVQTFSPQRLAYPLNYWNAVGTWAAIVLVIAVAWSAQARTARGRAVLLAPAPIAGLIIYLTYSRSAVLVAVLGVLVALALTDRRRATLRHAVAVALCSAGAALVASAEPDIANGTGSGGVALVVAVLVLAVAACASVAARSSGSADSRGRMRRGSGRVGWAILVALAVLAVIVGPRATPELTNQSAAQKGLAFTNPSQRFASLGNPRNQYWSEALDAFASEPVHGIGAGSFEFWYDSHSSDPTIARDAHSIFMTALAELGLPGLVLTVGAFGGLLALALRARRLAATPADAGVVTALVCGYCVFVLSAAIDWTWEVPALALLGLGAGVVAGASMSSPTWFGARWSGRRTAAAVAIAIVAGAVQVPGIVSTDLTRASETALTAGHRVEAAQLANEAITAEPWAASPRAEAGIVSWQQGNLGAAQASLEAAISREQTNWFLRQLLAEVQASNGDVSGALRSLAAMKRLRPAYASIVDSARQRIEAAKATP